MTTNTTDRNEQQQAPGPSLRPWHELRRSSEDSKIAGVCGGLARWLDVDPLLVRVVMVALVLAGGVGVLGYAILWLTVPREDEAESPGARLIAGRGDESVVWPVLLFIVGLSVAGGTWVFGSGHGPGLALVAVIVTFVLLRRGRRFSGPVAPYGGAPASGAQPPAASFAQGGTGTWPPAAAQPQTPTQSPSQDEGDEHGGGPSENSTGEPWMPPTVPMTPTTPMPSAPAPRRREPRGPLTRVTLSLAAVAVGLTLAWGALTDSSVPSRIALAIALAVVAAGLLVSAVLGLMGRGTGRRGGLVVVGAFLALAVATTSSWHAHFTGGNGTHSYSPTTDAATTAGYHQGAGDLRLDLRQLPTGEHTVHAELGAGNLVVIVPPEAAVHLQANAGVGEVRVVGADGTKDSRDGFGVNRDVDLPPVAGSSNSFDLDLQVGIGEVEVRRG